MCKRIDWFALIELVNNFERAEDIKQFSDVHT